MHYVPYKGASYDAGFKYGLKLLLLGDSFYDGVDRSTAPTEAVEQNVSHGEYRFFNNVQRIVTGTDADSVTDRQAFWDKVAFTNLVQEPVATATTKPTEEQWKDAWEKAFPDIVRQTMPDVIFVFSKRGWDIEYRFASPFKNGTAMDLKPSLPGKDAAYLRDFSTLRPGYYAVSGCFDNPSFVQRTNQWNEWHDWATRLLDAAPGVLGRTGPAAS